MSDLVIDLTASLQKQIDSFNPQVETRDVGTVTEAGDGIARAEGLGAVQAQELVQFANGVMGIAFNLEQDSVGIIIMGDLNDAPTDKSLTQSLNAQEWTQNATTDAKMLYNLGAPVAKRNEGTIYYKGWSVFDQIIVSGNLLNKTDKEETIFKADFMVFTDKAGNKLPNRTYTGPIYRGGYSDHFPVYVNIYLK